jgi:hypothetical protein
MNLKIQNITATNVVPSTPVVALASIEASLFLSILSVIASTLTAYGLQRTMPESDERKEDEDVTVVNDDSFLAIGGRKGHVMEIIHGNVLQLFRSFRWKAIPRCTGRYTCRDHEQVSHLTPLQMLQHVQSASSADGSPAKLRFDATEWKSWMLKLPGKTDELWVVPLDSANQTGIITYVKTKEVQDHVPERIATDPADTLNSKCYVHTLNTVSGFRRKLAALGLRVNELSIEMA